MSRYRVRDGKVSSRVLDGEAILLSHETNHCYALNTTGCMAWELIERPEGASLEEIATLWAQPRADDLQRMLTRLHEENLVEAFNGPLAPARKGTPAEQFEPFQLEKYGTLEQLILSGE